MVAWKLMRTEHKQCFVCRLRIPQGNDNFVKSLAKPGSAAAAAQNLGQSYGTFAGIIPTEHQFRQQSNHLKIHARGVTSNKNEILGNNSC